MLSYYFLTWLQLGKDTSAASRSFIYIVVNLTRIAPDDQATLSPFEAE